MSRIAVSQGRNGTHDRRSDQSRVQVVYFVLVIPEATGTPVIKIGETGNFDKRLKDLRKPKHGQSFKVDPLCLVRGTRDDEQQALKYFAKYRLDNEQETFLPVEELVDYIRWLRDQHFVWVPDCDQCPPIEDMAPVEALLWMPSAERRKGPPPPPPVPDPALFEAEEPSTPDYGPLNLPPREVTADDFYTSPSIIAAVHQVMGAIDLDPASHAVANKVVKARRFYSIHDNGLSREWEGRVWLNPPFSKWQEFVPKILAELQSGRISSMCVLCATRTLSAEYFSPIHESCAAMCITRGRIRFWGGRAGDAPDDGHAIFYFGEAIDEFADAFASIGNVYTNHRRGLAAR